MADFFSNLILRSSPAVKGAGSILQPRLPSLFESTLGGADELPTPQTDSALHLSSNTPDALSAQAEARQPAEAARPAAASVTAASPAPNGNPVSHAPSQPQVEEPSRTVRAPLAAGNVFRPAPAIGTDHATPALHNSQPESSPMNTPQAKGQPVLPSQVRKNSADGLSPSLEQIPSKAILQPMPLTKPVSHAAQPQPAPQERGETVVQVHIGRIEVRAVMPPTPVQPAQTSRAQPKMSLDEYLRQREEKR